MKTLPAPPEDTATIVRLADLALGAEPEEATEGDAASVPQAVAATLGDMERARAFAEPLLAGRQLDTGEPALAHADGVAAILGAIGAAPTMRAAAYLVYAADHLQRPDEDVARGFGESYAVLVENTRRLVQIQRAARAAQVGAEQRAQQTERVRKMLLAFSRDLRVVLLRLASRLQSLRWFAASKTDCPQALAAESLEVFAPLANRLGIWQIKWEVEDLAFRFLQPESYHRIARQLDSTRAQREAGVLAAAARLRAELAAAGVRARVQGRPKHLYSIWKKMQGKRIDFAQVLDLHALRVIVGDVPACYAALACVHARYRAIAGEFDDYIARPKPNGYQSLHTVVLTDDGRAIEVQIRTQAMHEHAEYGVAAHWAYKEAGARGYAGVSAGGAFEERVAEARKAVLRQLLAWERDFAQAGVAGAFDERIYVFTPQASIVELPAGSTAIDFAYSLHTELGHRCRGAKVDGAMVQLTKPLANGQTVEVVSAKDGGPSLDWLNPELGYLKSPRAKAKVRAWFNAQAQAATVARGREQVEKLLQREGRTSVKHDDLAERLGFKNADALFEVVGKDELSLRSIEALLKPTEPAADTEPTRVRSPLRGTSRAGDGGVLVVGVQSLLTSLARCCRPAPPDAIGGFVTRGKGVAIHRSKCSNFRHMAEVSPERVIAVAWDAHPHADAAPVFPVDVLVEAVERNGLLRDVGEVFAKEKMNVTGVHNQALRDGGARGLWLTFTVELADTSKLSVVLQQVLRIPGVRGARRK